MGEETVVRAAQKDEKFEEGRELPNQKSRRVGLKRLIFVRVLKTERLGGFGRACISQFVTFSRHLHERLTCSKDLWRLSVKFQNNRALDDIDKPRRRMEVRTGRRTRRQLAHPHLPLLSFHVGQVRLQQLRTPDWLLLSNGSNRSCNAIWLYAFQQVCTGLSSPFWRNTLQHLTAQPH
jgi:hypothetical protein